jgi:hypothetical protein
MSRVRVAISAALCCALAACSSSSMPSFGFNSGSATQTLQLESEPPGAEAKTQQGQACRTPCSMVVPVAPTSVTFSLSGYHPQLVSVEVTKPPVQRDTEFSAFDAGPELTPNPVAVALEMAPPQPAPTRRRSSSPPRQPRPAAQQTAPAAVQPASPFPPPPTFPPPR